MQTTIKRLLALILALSMCLSLLSANVWAADSSGDASGASVASGDLSVQEEVSGEGSDSSADGSESETEDASASDTAEAEEDESKEDQSEPEEEEDEKEEKSQAEEVEPEEEDEEEKSKEKEPEEEESEEVTPEEEVTTQAGSEINLSTVSGATTAKNGDTLTGTLGGNYKISIADGATVTLSDVTINGTNNSSYSWAGITCLGDATIILDGTNRVKGFYQEYPGIQVGPTGKTLTIQGSGSLNVSSNSYSSGIGGGYGNTKACGNIVIAGGTITATGGSGGAGIGSGGSNATCGDITITGGTITAKGGVNGAGIGGGQESNCGKITITGGTVNATGGGGAGIGSGYHATCSDIAITGGTITATGGATNGIGSAGIGSAYSFSNQYVNYKSSCGSITITDGVTMVKATKGGNATYSIGAGKDSTCGTVTVLGVEGAISDNPYTYFIAVTNVSLNKTSTTLSVGDTEMLTATVSPNNAMDRKVKWSVGGTNASAVTLYEDNTCQTAVALNTATDRMTVYAKGVSAGSAAVTVTSNSDSTKSASCSVTVHAHTFTYSLSEDGRTITAACTADGCNLPEVDGKHAATLTIAAPTTGNDAVITVSPEGVLTGYTLRYQTKSGGTWGAETNTAPSAAGIHKANVTLGGVTASVSWGNNCITYADNLSNGSITGATSATCGAAVEPTITPDTGYELDALTVTPEQGSGVTSVELTADGTGFVMPEANVTVSATFKKINSAITVTQPTGGTVTAKIGSTDVTTADYGDTITLGNTPADGYTFDSYTVTKTGDSSTSVAVNNGTFSMPPYPVTVTAAFTAIDYTVTVTQPETGGTIGASKTTANVGDEITLSVTPAAGYELDTLTVTDANNQDVTVTDNKFTMPASAVTVTAAFTAIDYTIAIAETTNGSVTTTTDLTGVFHIGDEVTLTVTPDKNYGLKSITTTSGTLAQTDVNQETGALTYVLTMGAGDATVTAEFSTLTSYTIFYNASGSPDAVSVRLTGNDGEGYPMSSSAKLGNIDCWSTQVLGGEGSASLAFSIKEGTGDWTTLDIPVVDSVPNTLAAGSAVAIEGEVNAFAVAFVWGEDADTDSLYYLVTPNTQSVDVPNPADTASESFAGWTYLAPSSQEGGEAEEITVDKGTGSSTTVSLDKITQTTIVGAIWMPVSYTIHFDPDNGENATTQSVTYGSTVSKPANPTKAGYEFDCWVLADNAVEMSGDKTVQLSPGTAFDFNLKIINNLSLKAKWKHVHSYVCLPLDHSTFDGAFADYYGYKGQLHIKLCTSMDDYCAEAHSFVNGKCACGASITDNKVKLTKKVGGTTSESNVVKNSIVSITAPEKQSNQTFSKWQYSTNDATWYDLTTMRGVAFAIPASMSVKAVYEQDRFKLTMNSFKYDSSHVAYQFNYSVPDGFTVVDGGLMLGDNVRMRFWDCTLNLFFLGSSREPSLRDAVKVYGGGTVANKMVNYQTINEPGSAKPIKKALKTFGKTGTVALAWQPLDLEGYKAALKTKYVNDNFNQAKYPTYAMGYIVCKDNRTGGYVGFMTNAISATLESPTHSDVTEIPVS